MFAFWLVTHWLDTKYLPITNGFKYATAFGLAHQNAFSLLVVVGLP